MSKICDKVGCENEIPHTKDGKRINIQRRRFCFECSPFGSKNTKDLNLFPIDRERTTSYQSVKKYRKSKKAKCIEYKGGKCCVCGYDKCHEALEFHHLNPDEKDFTISHKNHWSMNKTKLELDKCALVCSNCHREIHQGITMVA